MAQVVGHPIPEYRFPVQEARDPLETTTMTIQECMWMMNPCRVDRRHLHQLLNQIYLYMVTPMLLFSNDRLGVHEATLPDLDPDLAINRPTIRLFQMMRKCLRMIRIAAVTHGIHLGNARAQGMTYLQEDLLHCLLLRGTNPSTTEKKTKKKIDSHAGPDPATILKWNMDYHAETHQGHEMVPATVHGQTPLGRAMTHSLRTHSHQGLTQTRIQTLLRLGGAEAEVVDDNDNVHHRTHRFQRTTDDQNAKLRPNRHDTEYTHLTFGHDRDHQRLHLE
jgi:hypothetical protein